MRLLMVGSDNQFAIENFYKKYMAEAGATIQFFPAANLFYEFYYRSVINKIIYRAGWSNIINSINRQLKEKVFSFRPDAVWIFKGMEITAATLQSIRQQDILLVNYNPDNPFIFTGRGSGNQHVSNSIPLYDLHFTYNLEIKKQLEEKYKARTALLPFGFDMPEQLYEQCRQQEEVNKVCFLGNPDKERAEFIKQLLQEGISIDIYGNAWEKFIAHEKLTINGPVGGETFWKVLSRYRVQLNLMRIHNLQSHNMRSFEVPGIGGIQLAPDTPEHRLFFEPGKEIFLYRDVKECAGKCRSLLQLTGEEARTIRDNARKRSLTAGYSYKDRGTFALDVMQSAMKQAT